MPFIDKLRQAIQGPDFRLTARELAGMKEELAQDEKAEGGFPVLEGFLKGEGDSATVFYEDQVLTTFWELTDRGLDRRIVSRLIFADEANVARMAGYYAHQLDNTFRQSRWDDVNELLDNQASRLFPNDPARREEVKKAGLRVVIKQLIKLKLENPGLVIEPKEISEVVTRVSAILRQQIAGVFAGRVSDEAGAPIAADVRFIGPESRQLTTDHRGTFQVSLEPGEYVARIEGPGYLAKEQTFRIGPGSGHAVDLVLRKRPAEPNVEIVRNKIAIKGKIHFGSDNADIRPDSLQLLDEIVDLLVNHPEIKRVRVEGHTDDKGSRAANVKLSQDRAEAVRAYLVHQGIDEYRLEAIGYGPSKPIALNTSAKNREKNRRIEFRILD